MTPTRQKAKPVFDPPRSTKTSTTCGRPRRHTRHRSRSRHRRHQRRLRPAQNSDATPPATTTSPAQPASPATPSPTAVPQTAVLLTTPAAQPTNHTGDAQQPNKARIRPPEVLLSSEVYDELYRVQLAERKFAAVSRAHHGRHRSRRHRSPRHAPGHHLGQPTGRGRGGQLFERPSSNAVPRRRRHATAPRTVVLSGVTAANGQRLDNLVLAWGPGHAVRS